MSYAQENSPVQGVSKSNLGQLGFKLAIFKYGPGFRQLLYSRYQTTSHYLGNKSEYITVTVDTLILLSARAVNHRPYEPILCAPSSPTPDSGGSGPKRVRHSIATKRNTRLGIYICGSKSGVSYREFGLAKPSGAFHIRNSILSTVCYICFAVLGRIMDEKYITYNTLISLGNFYNF